jgi:hypothetical protein
MVVDNFFKIKHLLEFRSEDDFYFLQILQRKKDHVKGKINGTNNNSRLIKAYYIKSLEHFDFIEEEVIQLCEIFNARAGINLNRRSFEKMALQHLKKVTDQLLNKSYNKAHKAYCSVVGAYNNDNDKKWIIDIDKEELFLQDDIKEVVNRCTPLGKKTICILPSKSGVHIISSPFNILEFKIQLNTLTKLYSLKENQLNIEIHKNNPTNLYIP